jgi:hypothetical protein
VTDARSVYDSVRKLSTQFQEKCVQIDTTGLRQAARMLRWVPTTHQLADGLTKRSMSITPRNALPLFYASPVVSLVETKGVEDSEWDNHKEHSRKVHALCCLLRLPCKMKGVRI